ncbi:stemmadenine O-acetyltransferase-like [Humulus lupulus]|uniref:stemmadenine O-acetyltransferase-like n=1 Tax=Humulus lupulus TaxID=3486 RepID=UPI002B4053DD|nr:stemmadenine O-acetyltransferase-like [Humulus lupulus]
MSNVVEIEVISNEIIKPNSPTPDHLRRYKLSSLDQISPKVYNPLLFFYELNGTDDPDDEHHKFNNITFISNHLKKSLSEVLALFYPLAGRQLKGDLIVDCNDEGVPFLEAKVKGQSISDAIKAPIASDHNKFLPFKLDEVGEFALGVQLNVFESGGIVIGVCISHKLADALSSIMFVKTWVATARGEADTIAPPEFVSATLFPPKNLRSYDSTVGITRKNIIAKRFIFDSTAIETLKTKLSDQDRAPSRVEALSTFIWSRFMAATYKSDDSKKLYTIIHPVNLRPKFDPPLQNHHFGNYYRVAFTVVPSSCISTVGEDSCGRELVKQIREEIKKIDTEFVTKLIEGNEEHFDILEDSANRFVRDELVTSAFTSLLKFPIYEADFGWGNPTWVGSPALNFSNVTAFFDTKTGDGIEAYISLNRDDMAKLEADNEFQAFVSPLLGC